MSWRPLLEGDEAARAREAIAAIAADLAAAPLPEVPQLDGGLAGRALFAACLARDGDRAAADRAAAALEQALERLDRAVTPWLLDGVSGVAWTAAHLADIVEVDDDTLVALDDLVGAALAHDPWPFEWEYVLGLVGAGLYALERSGPTGAAKRARVVALLAGLAERPAGGVTWRSPPTVLRAEEASANRDGYYNLGLAHGIAGAIGLLTGAIDAPGARELVAGAVGWLRPHDTGDPARRFPYALVRGRDQGHPRRDGWCYGDQAVAITLIRAGRAMDEPDWIAHGVAVARDVARREPDMPLDACLCHGTLGRAHLFNRMAQATGDGELAEAARAWYRETLARRQPGRGVGGYATEKARDSDESLLVGAPGIALGLLAAVSESEPAWDRAFLISP